MKLKAMYAGDAGNRTSRSALLEQVVSKATPINTLTTSANPSRSGQPLTFTVNVAGYAPSGNVAVKDGLAALATVIPSGSGDTCAASFATSTLSAGSHNIATTSLIHTNKDSDRHWSTSVR